VEVAMKQVNAVHTTIEIKDIIKALIISLAVTFVLFLVFACVMFISSMNESHISGGVFIISIISLIVGGIIASKNAEKAGFLHGGIVAVCYIAIVFLGSVIMNKGLFFNPRMLAIIIGGLAAGVFGGIIGINFNFNKKHKKR